MDSFVCAACEGQRFAKFGMREGYTYVECLACGSLQLHPLPTAAHLAEKYAKDYAQAKHCEGAPDVRDRMAAPYDRAILAALRAHLPPGARVMDYGAGWGGLSARLTAAGYDVLTVEPSGEMFQHCQARGLRVVQGDLYHPDIVGPFDAIVLSAVFEHLVDHDAWMERAARLLTPGGVFLSFQPTAPFPRFFASLLRLGNRSRPLPQLHQVICPPWHTVLFSIAGMRALLTRHAFTLAVVRRGPQGRSAGWTGFLQRILDTVNRAGWAIAGTRWPGVIGHIFVAIKQ